ncbi:MAG TPA: DUF998 domain-containing protein [Pseudonocardiaceae bacterium]|jgi:hypothetical protein|nr:DUF998 domain-containing protein [Pseudonocardiaceae bacterium]
MQAEVIEAGSPADLVELTNPATVAFWRVFGQPMFGRPRVHRVAAFGNRLLVPFGLLAFVVAAVMMVGLHLLPDWGGVNPIFGMLSDYGVTRYGWVFDSALDIMSIGSLAIMVKMVWHGVLRGRPASILMFSWCIFLVGIASFTKDPNSGTDSVRGAIHLYSTAAACASLPFASLVIGWQHRKHPNWRRFALTSQGLSLASVPCLLPFLISFFVIRMTHSSGTSGVPTGLVERLMGLVDIAILVVLALWAHRASTVHRAQLATGTA